MKRILSLFLSVLVLLSAVGPAAAENTSDQSMAGRYSLDSLTVGTATAFTGNFLNSLFGNNGADIDVQELIHTYSPVEWVNTDGTYEINPAVVSNLIISDDARGNRTYRVFLYSDLYYSDGSRITAADYVFSILLAACGEIVEIGGVTPDLSYIVGADDYTQGNADFISGVQLLSESAFAVTVKASALPNYYELSLLDFKPYPISMIAPGCRVADEGNGAAIQSGDRPFSAEMLQETLLDPETGYVSHPSVTSGAYVLTSYDGEVCEFDLNPYYKGDAEGRKPVISHLTYKTVPNERMAEALASGEIGLANKLSSSSTIQACMALVAGGTYRYSSYLRSGASFISFSCERIAMSDLNVRKAIAYSFDKDTAVASYVGNFGKRVDGCYGIGQWMVSAIGSSSSGSDDEDFSEEDDSAGLTMDDIPVYDPDPVTAVSLLEESGWTLNREGSTYRSGTDDVRCKAFTVRELEDEGMLEDALAQGGIETTLDGTEAVLLPLSLTMAYPEGNAIADCLQETLIQPLADIGIQLQTEAVPYQQLLKLYYRMEDRDCDLMYLATNFTTGFDLSRAFTADPQDQVLYNTTGLADEELSQAASDLIHTTPGEIDEYCAKWIAFQTLYQEKVPGIFVYSNVYMDVYTYVLNDYVISNSITWTKAILNAYLSDPVGLASDTDLEGSDEEDSGEEEFDDEEDFGDEEEFDEEEFD